MCCPPPTRVWKVGIVAVVVAAKDASHVAFVALIARVTEHVNVSFTNSETSTTKFRDPSLCHSMNTSSMIYSLSLNDKSV